MNYPIISIEENQFQISRGMKSRSRHFEFSLSLIVIYKPSKLSYTFDFEGTG